MASVCLLLTSFFLLLHSILSAKQTYIVHLKHHENNNISHQDWFSNHLFSISSESNPTESFLYTYTSAYNGFAAALTPVEAESLRNSDSVLGVHEDLVYSLQTTHSPEFLGLPDTQLHGYQQLAEEYSGLSDVVIGMLDTGIWPESRSFLDHGLPDVPSRWKGECEEGPDFSPKACNKKLIGARSFSKGFRMTPQGKNDTTPDSPRDHFGHGSHTASTAAGSHVSNVSYFGFANGTARGMATGARVAAYKVCWNIGCMWSDMLAGMEKAIEDGVDILSMSIRGPQIPYYNDTIAIGAFLAVQKGIFVSCAAGNSGPKPSSVSNLAPWIMTVGAGTLDRNYPAHAVLGDHRRLTGVSLYNGKGMGKNHAELVYNSKSTNESLCIAGSLKPELVKGKVVLCDRGLITGVEKGGVVRDAGGVGMILANTADFGENLYPEMYSLPALMVGQKDGDIVRNYVKTTKEPTAVLSFDGTVLGVRPSPMVASFSSRGPNTITPQILKPDVIGPGVRILAAWSESDNSNTPFVMISGTSMSCPHISGIAALLKAAHPDWSPSAIKSALMTTAYTHDNTNSPLCDGLGGNLSTPFAHGSGHVDFQRAISPGLVYDLSTSDYNAFLCSLNYTMVQIRTIVNLPNFTCSGKFSDPGQLNYPSFSVLFGRKRVVRYTRELTNVGASRSTYNVVVTGPTSVRVKVTPTKLVFCKMGDKQSYMVTFISERGGNGTNMDNDAFGSISWYNDEHQVRSPIAYVWSMV